MYNAPSCRHRSCDSEVSIPAEESIGNSTLYQDLCSDCAEVRLCKILDGYGHSPIEIDLFCSSLDTLPPPTYTCLSYVWGPETPVKHIYLNGRRCVVRENLFLALRRLRQIRPGAAIWIDALCIKQNNDVEKTGQVALMARIFAESREVVIWLGETESVPADPDAQASGGASDSEGDNVVEAVSVIELLANDKHFHALPYFDNCRNDQCPASTLDASGGHWPRLLRCLEDLLDVPWFSRTWTVQEVVRAEDATVMRGSVTLPWHTLVTACLNWARHFDSCCHCCIFDLPVRAFKQLQHLVVRVTRLHHAKLQQKRDQALHEILINFNTREATDPRDKIYGLLSLQSESKRIDLKPDYTLLVRDVFIDTAVAMMRKEKWSLPLHCELEQEMTGLPSWVPDWTLRTAEPAACLAARLECAVTYDAAPHLKGSISVLCNNVLMITAARFDVVLKVSPAHRMTNTLAEQLNLVHEWYTFVEQNKSAGEEYVGGGGVEEALQMTMLAGRYHDSQSVRRATMQDVERLRMTWSETTRRLREKPDAPTDMDPDIFSQNIASLRRRIFVTASGYVGLCPDSVHPGDEIFVVMGAPAPIFLRPCPCEFAEDAEILHHRALGHGYIHGLMDGEAARMNLAEVALYIK